MISNVAYRPTLYKTGVKSEFSFFFQEIFTEQVVAYHAVRVPVTPNLSSKITGFLPVHCIHQLLKCRAFSKHKVPIKDWIYKWVSNQDLIFFQKCFIYPRDLVFHELLYWYLLRLDNLWRYRIRNALWAAHHMVSRILNPEFQSFMHFLTNIRTRSDCLSIALLNKLWKF